MLAWSIPRNATLGLAMILAATLAATNKAAAHHWHHHHHSNWGWVGPAFVGGVALGALATPYYRRHHNCGWERHVFWRHGYRIVRYVEVCYR